jgi:hypothetical protein
MAGSFAHPSLSFINNLKTSFYEYSVGRVGIVLQFSKVSHCFLKGGTRQMATSTMFHLYSYSRDTLTCQEEQFLSNMRDGQLPYSLTSFVYFQLNI